MVDEEENLSERLKFSLKILGLSQTELANKINVKPQIIQYLCQGSAEKSKFTFDIAEALNIDVSWLATGKGKIPTATQLENRGKTIPALTFEQIREQKIFCKKINLEKIEIWIPVNEDTDSNSFAAIINDKSMAPQFDLDTIIILETLNETYSSYHDKFVLVYLAEEDFLIFRKLKITKGTKLLKAHNNNLYKNVILKKQDIILGFCKEARWSI